MALLADYANVTKEGKLNVLGIFHQLRVARLPAQHPSMQLILMLEGNRGDADREQKIELRLMAPSGKDVFKMDGTFLIKDPEHRWTTIRSNQILQIHGLTFHEAGGHIFYVYLNNHQETAVALEVVIVAPEEPQQRLPGT